MSLKPTMKNYNLLLSSPLSELHHDRPKRTRAKSPTNAKNKQIYLQNLEKKLDELLNVATIEKKNSTLNLRPGTTDLATASNYMQYDKHKVTPSHFPTHLLTFSLTERRKKSKENSLMQDVYCIKNL